MNFAVALVQLHFFKTFLYVILLDLNNQDEFWVFILLLNTFSLNQFYRAQSILAQCCISIPPENGRKSLVFRRFQEVQKWNIWVKRFNVPVQTVTLFNCKLSITFHTENGHLNRSTNHMTGFYMKYKTGLKWVNASRFNDINPLTCNVVNICCKIIKVCLTILRHCKVKV